MPFVKRNKFGAVRQTYNGISFHSKLEAQYAAELDLRIKAKDIKSYRRQVKVELYAYGAHIWNYYVDFVITHNDGTEEWVEVKGFPTNEWKKKWQMFEAKMKQEQPRAILTIVR